MTCLSHIFCNKEGLPLDWEAGNATAKFPAARNAKAKEDNMFRIRIAAKSSNDCLKLQTSNSNWYIPKNSNCTRHGGCRSSMLRNKSFRFQPQKICWPSSGFSRNWKWQHSSITIIIPQFQFLQRQMTSTNLSCSCDDLFLVRPSSQLW